MKTVREYTPVAMSLKSAATRSGWSSYAARFVAEFGDRPLESVTHEEIMSVANDVRTNAKRRANSNGGQGAQEGFVSCVRSIYKHALNNPQTGVTSNPALLVAKDARTKPQKRRALTVQELQQVQSVLINHTRDPELGLLVLRTFLETGARRGELLALTVADVQRPAQKIRLQGMKKTGIRYQPVTDKLLTALQEFAANRHGFTGEIPPWEGQRAQFLNHRKEPITRRYLESTAEKIRRHAPQLGASGEVYFTWHLLRHTAGTLVERSGGFAVSQKFLGHKGALNNSAAAVTLRYTEASDEEVKKAVHAIWGA